ncbi:MAG: hypothetical protein ACP5QO_12910 [Clostridia bacterium]
MVAHVGAHVLGTVAEHVGLTATGHIALRAAALMSLPVDPLVTEVIVRADRAGCSHKFWAHCATRRVLFCVEPPLTAELATIILDHAQLRWIPALTADGPRKAPPARARNSRAGRSDGPPPGTRMMVRRKILRPGAQLRFTDVRATATNCA